MFNNDDNYKSGIDVLRAFSVLAVIAYHLKPNIISGGFLGVDIFFLISGFLISSIIYRQKYNNIFNLKSFYLKRIRRIVPVLAFVILTTLLFGFLILNPTELIRLSQSSISGISFITNMLFYKNSITYGTHIESMYPLLHTWSLSIEGQFYIIFPLIFLILIAYLNNRLILFCLILIITINFIIIIYGKSIIDINFLYSFYSPFGRLWEFALGVVTFFLSIKSFNNFKVDLSKDRSQFLNFFLGNIILDKNSNLNKFFKIKKNISKYIKDIYVLIGLVLIFYSFVFLNDVQHIFPSLFSIIPLVGTVFIILFYKKESSTLNFIFNSPALIFIGLISYSLYLWHYPILIFFNYLQINIYIYLTLIFTISYLSYRFLETPFRNKIQIPNFKLFIILATVFIVIFILFIHILFTQGALYRYNDTQKQIFYQKEAYIDRINPSLKCNYISSIDEACNFNEKSDHKVFLIGDCTAYDLLYDLSLRAEKNDFNLIDLTQGCIYLPGSKQVLTKENSTVIASCTYDYQKSLEDKLLNTRGEVTVIVGGRYNALLNGYFFNNKEGGIENMDNKGNAPKYSPILIKEDGSLPNQNDFKDSLTKLANSNINLILIYPIPEVGVDLSKYYNVGDSFLSRFSIAGKKDLITTSKKVYKERSEKVFKLFDSIEGKNVYRVYPDKVFCNEERCITSKDEKIYYKNSINLTNSGSKLVNDLIIDKIKLSKQKFQ